MKTSIELTTKKKLFPIGKIVYALFCDAISKMKVVGYDLNNHRFSYSLEYANGKMISNGIEDFKTINISIDKVFKTRKDACKEFIDERVSAMLYDSDFFCSDNIKDYKKIINDNKDIYFDKDYIEKAKEMKELMDLIISRNIGYKKLVKKFKCVYTSKDKKEIIVTGTLTTRLAKGSDCVVETETKFDNKSEIDPAMLSNIETSVHTGLYRYAKRKAKGIIEPVISRWDTGVTYVITYSPE